MRTVLPLAAVIALVPLLPTIGSRAALVQSPSASTPPVALVRIGYYLNDREQDPSRHCRLHFLNGTDLVAPASVAGFRYWYPKPTGAYDVSKQRIILKCDHYVMHSEAHYDLFDGDTAIVLDAYTKVDVLLGEDKYLHFREFDPHYVVNDGHGEGRFALQVQWKRLPTPVQTVLKGIYCLTILDGAGRIFFNFQYR